MFPNSSSQIDRHQAPEDQNIVDEVSNMTRTNKNDARVIIHMESEENNLDDGFGWRKYGRKVISGNPNTIRIYRKCTFAGCKVKKHVERGDNEKSWVLTYYGIHEHYPPAQRRRYCRLSNRSGSSRSHDPSNRTPQLGRSPSSKLPSLPDNENHGFMHQNDEAKTDRVIPDSI